MGSSFGLDSRGENKRPVNLYHFFRSKEGIREIFRVKYDYDFGSPTLSRTLENNARNACIFLCEETLRVQIGKVSESLISDAKPKEFESCEDVSC